ncbi:MAG: YXWGXW repeat-containing protein [Candidatus Sulfotelmatobacter sp.]
MKTNRTVRLLAFALVLLSLSAASFAQVFVSVRFGPPALPVYAQPICPGPGYLWTPGYWGWNDEGGYYWVPGTWVVAPMGMLWTPGYWGWGGGFYAWHAGYWGPHVGFYGGINYGFGYGGVGFVGGEWRGGGFFYNRAVMNVTNVHVNVYENRRIIVNNESHVAFNGGEGGVTAHASAQEEAWGREPHTAALAAQTEHEHAASQNHDLFASANHGRPEVAATARPGEFSGHGVVKAKAAGAEYHAPAMSPREARGPSTAEGMRNGTEAKRNNGFHSFTPPNKVNESNYHQSGNTARANQGNSREFNPASNNRNERGSANPMYQDKGNSGTNPLYESKDRAARPSSPKSNPPATRHNSAPPKHESAPREEHHKGR